MDEFLVLNITFYLRHRGIFW